MLIMTLTIPNIEDCAKLFFRPAPLPALISTIALFGFQLGIFYGSSGWLNDLLLETSKVYSGFLNDGVLLLNDSSHNFR